MRLKIKSSETGIAEDFREDQVNFERVKMKKFINFNSSSSSDIYGVAVTCV